MEKIARVVEHPEAQKYDLRCNYHRGVLVDVPSDKVLRGYDGGLYATVDGEWYSVHPSNTSNLIGALGIRYQLREEGSEGDMISFLQAQTD
jgi:hypothetical protein